ncbi:MAG: sugar ABC transporter permease [Chloroflexi bacterium]|nr:sugar ABC transporter permease [Chloroflexota bacterium]
MFTASRRRPIGAKLYPYLYLLPGLTAMVVTTFIPAVVSIILAFTNYSVLHLQDWKFIGLRNFEKIILGSKRSEFIGVFTWTVTWAVLATLLAFLTGLGLALLLNNRKLRERNLYRTILILPWAMPSTITILAWAGLLSTSFGPINRTLIQLGFKAVPWLSNPFWAKVSCMIVNLWIGFPFMMVACLGALQSIPDELYEVAKMDGAGSWQLFRHITFPLLRDATLPLLISGFAFQFTNFGVIYLLTGGGPYTNPASLAGATDLLATYMYKMAFSSNDRDYALAAANGMLIFLIVGSLTVVNSWLTGAFREVER